MITVKSILIERLKQLGADGLHCHDCGCELNDLAPCGAAQLGCVAARHVKTSPESHAMYAEFPNGYYVPLLEIVSPARRMTSDVENGISWLEGLLEVKSLRSDSVEQCKEIRKAIEAIKGQAKQISDLAAENDRLARMFAEDAYIESAVMEPGYYDLRLRGKGALLVVGQLLQIFRDSGGKNFSTNTFQMKFGDSKTYERFELTIQKVNGEDSPAQKLERQAKHIADLEIECKGWQSAYKDLVAEWDRRYPAEPLQSEVLP